MTAVSIAYDLDLIAEIAARFDLRTPNRKALGDIVRKLADVNGSYVEMVADLATGVGKTYLMSALVDYLAAQGVRHVLVVTPGSTIQAKTVANFDEAHAKYVAGAELVPYIITPESFQRQAVGAALRNPDELKVFVFNVQQLIAPRGELSRKVRQADETLGAGLYDLLHGLDDLVIIADEHHLYHEKAKAFSAAIRDLNPVALVGLTATPDQSDIDAGRIVSQYSLARAIAEGHVKVPVIAYRVDGTDDHRTQLADACALLRLKADAYSAYVATTPGAATVPPVLFVVCRDVDEADETGQLLAGAGFIGDPNAVLVVTSKSSDEALQALADVEKPDSPIRAIVSVNMLKEGWDVKNIAVIVTLRKLASQTLTEQILGRGLRLPFGKRTGVPMVDQVDLVAHDSYKQLLAQKEILRQRLVRSVKPAPVDDSGAAVIPELSGLEDPANLPDAPIQPEDGVAEEVQPVDAPRWDGDELMVPGEEGADEELPQPGLVLVETDTRVAQPAPAQAERVAGAPQVIFPVRTPRLVPTPFSLSSIDSPTAKKAGERFKEEFDVIIARVAVEGEVVGEDDATLKQVPQAHAQADQELSGIDTVREDLVTAVGRAPETPRVKESKGAADRIVKAFLAGAGATNDTDQWGAQRRAAAVDGIRKLVREEFRKVPQTTTYAITPVDLPVEPVLVSDSLDAHNDAFVPHRQFTGWKKAIMPVQIFDAGTTEFQVAKLMDLDPNITWWQRVYTSGAANIPRSGASPYYPDFVVLDKDGVQWVVEAKADDSAQDPDVVAKAAAAREWARAVTDDGDYGEWKYLFVTESDIRKAAASWKALVLAAHIEA
ncbi:DEAD/DEAH box helicase family protein [Microbacterium sp. 2C]|uniref:DEAD/DEAH box helicase n=1 Tax=Microbacterium paulum TaxID=2707006 RepID=UPI0018C2628B|nr:DEAD/DEAH box helicase family protein [Microbacterium paulum]MBG0716996.1 DEAD/DEAH box helicase family protein [Microbacterium paulum]